MGDQVEFLAWARYHWENLIEKSAVEIWGFLMICCLLQNDVVGIGCDWRVGEIKRVIMASFI